MKQPKHLFLVFLLIASVAVQAQIGIGSLPAASAQLDVSSTGKGFLPPRMDSTQRNAISSPVAGLTIYNTTINANQVYNGTAWYSTVHFIGERFGGGVVYYIYDNGQHGLISATADFAGTIQWYNGVYRYTGTLGDGVNAGAMNTKLIVATQLADNAAGTFAAKACADYSLTVGGITYGDWYLPSKEELHLLMLQKAVVGGFVTTNTLYLSSTEIQAAAAWGESPTTSVPGGATKSFAALVRAVRSF